MLEGFVLVSWSSCRMTLWCLMALMAFQLGEGILKRLSLMSVARNLLVAVVVCLFEMMIKWGFFDY